MRKTKYLHVINPKQLKLGPIIIAKTVKRSNKRPDRNNMNGESNLKTN